MSTRTGPIGASSKENLPEGRGEDIGETWVPRTKSAWHGPQSHPARGQQLGPCRGGV